MITIDILQLIDRLEETLAAGWRVPWSNQVAIDRGVFLNIVDQIRITIPKEIKKAREVEQERDKYIAQAHEEARRIIAQAREDAARLLDEHQLRREALTRAEALIQAAEREAQRIRAGADEYAEGQLRLLGQQVAQLDQVVRNGLTVLDARRTKLAEAEKAEAAAKQAEAAQLSEAARLPEVAKQAAGQRPPEASKLAEAARPAQVAPAPAQTPRSRR